MRTSVAWISLLLLGGCQGAASTAEECAEASAHLATCSGTAVPASFADACAADPAMAPSILKSDCAALSQDSNKADFTGLFGADPGEKCNMFFWGCKGSYVCRPAVAGSDGDSTCQLRLERGSPCEQDYHCDGYNIYCIHATWDRRICDHKRYNRELCYADSDCESDYCNQEDSQGVCDDKPPESSR